MKASKKDFEAIAESLKTLKQDLLEADTDNGQDLAWRKHVKEIARICGMANLRFKVSTFYDACGMP